MQSACLLSPAVRERLSFVEDHGLGTVDDIATAVTTPGPWYHLRVNTLKIDTGTLLENLQAAHPDEIIEQGDGPCAIKIAVRQGVHPPLLPRFIEVDRFAGESILMSAPLYAPGFKCAPTRFTVNDEISMVTRISPSWRPGTERVLVTCGNGIAGRSSSDMHLATSGVVVRTTVAPFTTPHVQDWPAFRDGLVLDQNVPSMIASHALAPAPGDMVLDACCGAGGKTTHLAQLMNDTGRITAVDRSAKRLQRLSARAARMGIACIEPVRARMDHVVEATCGQAFDKVLVDPPCSALGLRPKLIVDMGVKELDNFKDNQARIWDHVAPLVSSGTRCVHCTCTMTLEENEQIVALLCDKHDMRLVDPGIDAGHPGIQIDTLSRDEARKLVRFYPHLDGTIGFFIATMERR